MRPIKVYYQQKSHGMDMGADCVLDVLSDFRGPVPTETLVRECHKDKIAAPATTYKKLSMLKAKGFAADYEHPEDRDQRKSYIHITEKGMQYLNKWEGASALPQL